MRRWFATASGRIGVSVRRLVATGLLGFVYGAAAWLSRVLSRQIRRRHGRVRPSRECILVIGTFHNPNWFRSHLRPLARSGLGEVVLVCDEPVEAMDGVRFECPPRWMASALSRAGAKLVWSLRCALRYRPDIYVGYHIFPCAVIALVVARVFRRPACYQDTSGPLELEGGGWHAENPVLRALQGPSPLMERLAWAVVREFDSVVVRGSGAEKYIRATGYRRRIAVITGSVEAHRKSRAWSERSYDLAFVGRLTEYKRPDRFVAVAAAVAAQRPGTRAVLIGTGPDADALRSQVHRLGLGSSVELTGQRSDVEELLGRSRVFVLTSRWEGLSIAMLEAMTAGAVPVVADVGDLSDLIEDGMNGYLVEPDDIDRYANRCLRLLDDEQAWRRCSANAVVSALAHSGVDGVALRWRHHLRGVMARTRPVQNIRYRSQPPEPSRERRARTRTGGSRSRT